VRLVARCLSLRYSIGADVLHHTLSNNNLSLEDQRCHGGGQWIGQHLMHATARKAQIYIDLNLFKGNDVMQESRKKNSEETEKNFILGELMNLNIYF